MAAPLPEKIQTAVVTGGATGFGALAVRALHKAGFRVVITDVETGPAEALAQELDLAGETAVTGTLDVTKPDDFQTILDRSVERWGSVEVLVNNAARTAVQPVLEIDPADFNAIMAVNAGGTFTGCQIFGRHFRDRGYGRIINMASLAGQNGGTATGAHYAASKGAILTLTKIFARDLAPFGVTCNAIAPGPMDTPMVRSVITPEKMAGALANIPVGKLGDPDFVAGLVALLAGPEAAFVTGACWDVNGGIYMR
ncbi:3-oxoacyl-[acyl-carrier-protein] reductase FabG [Pannonibacter phragmitetus]|uniref:3-oxoacyl-[acyl-carrier-protein] reductase FabG n=1 Tax=Pannonibacter phragmitetus TaxID=121719 RepID=A0A378ZVV0_9HYPH|nr:SDR family oxidoreductase [Pannonibacter phragmitetus]SUB01325.1 3-oxoacyl-[acyl-carrier-protein] reductase FabG [Pannonibacter phragmitetus]